VLDFNLTIEIGIHMRYEQKKGCVIASKKTIGLGDLVRFKTSAFADIILNRVIAEKRELGFVIGIDRTAATIVFPRRVLEPSISAHITVDITHIELAEPGECLELIQE
jgi:hypothetical protein